MEKPNSDSTAVADRPPAPDYAAEEAEAGTPAADQVDDFKEGGYGWVVIACLCLTNAHTFAYNSNFAVFLAYYLQAGLFPGATPLQYAFVGALGFALSLFVSPLVTATIRKYGTRTAFFIGVALQTVGYIGASFTTQIWHLILGQGVAFGIGVGFTFSSTVGLPPQWFKKRRALANGIATAGTGLGGLVYALATNSMIQRIGLPWTLRVLAIIAFVVLTTCGIFIRDRNKHVGSVFISFDWSLFRRTGFLLFFGWVIFFSLAYAVVVFSLADYVEQVGFTANEASIAVAMFNVSTGFGRPFIGIACDHFGKINVTAVSTLISALTTFFIWIFAAKYYAGSIVFSLLGVFIGIVWATFAPVAAEVVGVKLLPSAMSITLVACVIPYTFGEPIGVSIKSPGPDGYFHAQIYVGVMYMAAFVCIWVLRAWKISQLAAKQLEASSGSEDAVASAIRDVQKDGRRAKNVIKRYIGYTFAAGWV